MRPQHRLRLRAAITVEQRPDAKEGEKRPVLIQIYAAVVQQERAMISRRTKEALAAAKARGKELGRNGKKLGKKNAAAASRDKNLEPILRELSHLSSRAVAEEIERRGFGKLSYKTVMRARSRLSHQSKL